MNEVPHGRATRLRRGINLSHWFSQVYTDDGYCAEHFDSYIQEPDIELVRTLGFDHVRFPVACEPMLANGSTGQISEVKMARLKKAVELLLEHELCVILDIHPETPFKERLALDDASVAAFTEFWRVLATRMSDFDPERLFLEVLNEPCICNPSRWSWIQNQCVAAIREAAPEHTIIVSGDEWSQLPQLLLIEMPEDDNVIANFHMYEPSSFTHQGAKWGSPWMCETKGLAYPSRGSNAKVLLGSVENDEARRQLDEYIELDWDHAAYRRYIAPAERFRLENNVPVMCNEFGVYKKYAPRASRLRWTKDVISAFESADIAWTMWDYAGDFSIVKTDYGNRTPDLELLRCMGLLLEQ
ncbi:glycoside hydrolase family 5 protein [Cerasicoccus arenae]|uniref:Endoglucanase n=1 Tax=Cerasicoccus arenae TaxID=424488 RepID=A0A8J3DFV8_9BACT|nr:glycoside hydrolase family 5 protein [Cerasicoccus arenae]MBK1858128.1 glycoside hydrolase family 5 protein [Cerasicoccus arenae]GHB96661.1 endoglucanase [Cerasicoccus arenae]